MPHWTKVVVYPLGLAGFSLLILYRFSERAELPTWIMPAAALVALVGGLFLAYVDRSRRGFGSRASRRRLQPDDSQHHPRVARQVSHGNQSPNIANVEGGVTVNYQAGSKPSADKKDMSGGPA